MEFTNPIANIGRKEPSWVTGNQADYTPAQLPELPIMETSIPAATNKENNPSYKGRKAEREREAEGKPLQVRLPLAKW